MVGLNVLTTVALLPLPQWSCNLTTPSSYPGLIEFDSEPMLSSSTGS